MRARFTSSFRDLFFLMTTPGVSLRTSSTSFTEAFSSAEALLSPASCGAAGEASRGPEGCACGLSPSAEAGVSAGVCARDGSAKAQANNKMASEGFTAELPVTRKLNNLVAEKDDSRFTAPPAFPASETAARKRTRADSITRATEDKLNPVRAGGWAQGFGPLDHTGQTEPADSPFLRGMIASPQPMCRTRIRG